MYGTGKLAPNINMLNASMVFSVGMIIFSLYKQHDFQRICELTAKCYKDNSYVNDMLMGFKHTNSPNHVQELLKSMLSPQSKRENFLKLLLIYKWEGECEETVT